jgi:hypothetical protein
MTALLAGAVLVALLAGGCGGGSDIRALPPGSYVDATGSLSSAIQLFGDTVTADVDVVVDRRHVDPGRLTVKAAFTPYEEIGATEVERHDAGDLTRLRYRLRLRCLERACLTESIGTVVDPAGGAPRVFAFAPAQLLYTNPGAKQPRLLRAVRFPALEAVSRINGQQAKQVYGFPFRSTLTPLPSVTYRITPPGLAAILLAAALALLVLPTVLVVRWLRRRRPQVEEAPPEPTALERAVALVEWARGRENGAERRAALESLAVALEDVDGPALADETRRAAWAPTPPSSAEADRILAHVKEAHGDGS